MFFPSGNTDQVGNQWNAHLFQFQQCHVQLVTTKNNCRSKHFYYHVGPAAYQSTYYSCPFSLCCYFASVTQRFHNPIEIRKSFFMLPFPPFIHGLQRTDTIRALGNVFSYTDIFLNSGLQEIKIRPCKKSDIRVSVPTLYKNNPFQQFYLLNILNIFYIILKNIPASQFIIGEY